MQTRLLTAMATALVTVVALTALGTSPGSADDDAPTTHGAAGETTDGIDWTGDLARAEALAASTGRPLMVVFR